ncbi:hypothetical protein N7486_000436 [Penicillium sp. IBT 16267x]|nr:hypothetical protein N7486_000436 [Penicillium sp. IBT 16267x]
MAASYGVTSQCLCKEAEKLQLHVMEAQKLNLGEAHPDTLTSIGNLTITWKAFGQDSDVRDLLRRLLAPQK